MELLTLEAQSHSTTFAITTYRPTEFVDLTERIEAVIAETGLRQGMVNIQSLHTTAAIVVNEHEPLLLTDFAALLDRWSPRAETYHHDDESQRTVNLSPGERANGHAHCQALLLGTSVCLNVVRGQLHLGVWQRVFLVELDGPRRREVSVMAVGRFCPPEPSATWIEQDMR
jgi:secondary thiamine-phosphate synthase enzyme